MPSLVEAQQLRSTELKASTFILAYIARQHLTGLKPIVLTSQGVEHDYNSQKQGAWLPRQRMLNVDKVVACRLQPCC